MPAIGPSARQNAATLDAAKATSIKSTAASLVTSIATDVSNGNFAAAAKKAHQLGDLYGSVSGTRPPQQ